VSEVTVQDDGGVVYVVATPIGNLEDLSSRARRILEEASVIACEDTRRTGKLCSALGIHTPRISLYAQNELRRIPGLLDRLERGESVALVSDAGTPVLSDPGGRFVEAAIEAGFTVVPIPGPSAILAALAASGVAAQPFTFLGFPPRKGGARKRWLDDAARSPGTIVLFEAPGRVREVLRDLNTALGARRVVIARELTKKFEEFIRGSLGEIELQEPRGEVTIVVEGGDPSAPTESVDEEALIDALRARGLKPSDAARELAKATGLSRQEAYRRLIDRGS
jgi:16S rRNA (cytidine1402-2'-O)-methyltransferase